MHYDNGCTMEKLWKKVGKTNLILRTSSKFSNSIAKKMAIENF